MMLVWDGADRKTAVGAILIFTSAISFQTAFSAESSTETKKAMEAVRVAPDTSTAENEPVPEFRIPDRAFAEFQRGNYLTAFSLALPQAEGGDAAAQTLIAEIYERGLGISKDTKQAAIWYEIAANSGNREAQFAFGVKLMKGQDVEQNVERGLELMQKAAEAGHPVANYNYANHIIDQRPTSAGYRQALPFYEKAAEYRLGDAYYSLSQIFLRGLTDGIERPKIGIDWLKRAARAGVDTAQVEFAMALLSGEIVEKDPSSAYEWFKTAALRGNVIAQNRLAHMYLRGIGTKQSAVEAAKWHLLARRAGRRDVELDRFITYLDEETRNKAQALANAWPTKG